MTSPVAFFINGIGDHVVNLPALRALAAWADGRLRIICSTHPASRVFSDLPADIVGVPWHQVLGHGEFEWRGAAAAIDHCDMFVSLVPWWSDSLKGLLDSVRPAKSVGFVLRGASHFDVNIPVDYRKHASCLPFEAARAVWPEACFEDFLEPPRFRAPAKALAAELVGYLPSGTKIMTVHAETRRDKMWCSGRLGSVLVAFLKEHPEYFCFLVGKRDIGVHCEAIEDRVFRTDEGALGSDKCMPLEVVQCLIAESDLFVGVDSCFLHVADFCRVPTVALFGPTLPSEWGCLLTANRTIQTGGRMEDIDVSEVLGAMHAMADITSKKPVVSR